MENTFKSSNLLNNIGVELVSEFARAGMATTPVSIGEGREHSIRTRLSRLLGGVVRVDSGFVISHLGEISKQQDIIVSESEFGVQFELQADSSTKYIPCESVFGAIEVKSRISGGDLDDIFQKSKSVKSLRRNSVAEKQVLGSNKVHPYRMFGSPTAFEPTTEEQYNQDASERDQVFFAAVTGEFTIGKDAILDKYLNSNPAERQFLPNLVVSLDGWSVHYMDSSRKQSTDPINSDRVIFMNVRHGFSFLVFMLRDRMQRARTVPLNRLNSYFWPGDIGPGDFKMWKHP